MTRARRSASLRSPITCTDCGHSVMDAVDVCPECGRALPMPAARSTRKPPRHYEDAHQTSLFAWANQARCTMPDLAKLYHVPNGGGRSKAEAGRLKAQGVVAGVLDLSLDVARGGHFGLRIELKATRAELGRTPQPSPEQRARIEDLRNDGYCAVVCEGWENAKAVLIAYVAQPRTVVA